MPPKKDYFKMFYALSLAWQLGFIIAVPIGGFLFLGFLADNFLKTKPLFLVIGFVAGFLITLYEVYHMFLPLINQKKENDKH
ncbi:MAG TPA: AtpZ/AtpI family protein [Candidatus Parcubacteria bacterium]|nr:AtpZ/AtpI family protein [Candidatus Parcubacteria bacterium]